MITTVITLVSVRYCSYVGDPMTRDEFEALPRIWSFFPLTFNTGRQRWTEFRVQCAECKKMIPDDATRGSVDRTMTGDSYRTVQSTSYQVVAHALCPKCNKLTTATYVLHEDMTCTGIDSETGEYSRWKMRKKTRWEKFVDWWRGEKK